VMTAAEVTALTKDATNRAARTLYVQLGIDVLVAVVMLLATTFGTANSWDEFNWKVLGFSLAKTIVSTIGSFVLRRFVDASSVPTPLPPAPVPPPNEDEPDPEDDPNAITNESEGDDPYQPQDVGDPDNPVEPEPGLTLHVEDPDAGEYDGTLPEELDVESPEGPLLADGGVFEDPSQRERSLDMRNPYETPERSMEDKAGE